MISPWRGAVRHLCCTPVLMLTCLLLPGSALAQAENPQISIFMGSSIDSFAAGDLTRYINAEESGELKERLIAGFDFQYELARSKTHTARGLVLFGQTLHGARSGEVDCLQEGNASKEVCQGAQVPTAGRSLAIFRQASTLEGFVGLRAELFQLGTGGSPSNLYVKGQLGFLTVAGKGGDVVDQHQTAVGLRLAEGAFAGSFFEIGYGRNDLFARNHGRKVVDAMLTFGKASDPKVKPFFEIYIDSDFDDGPDNIQTFIGLDVDVLRIFR